MTALWEDAGEKARTGRFPTQKAQTEQRVVLPPLLNTEQLREKCSWKRHRSPGLCHRRLRSLVSHPSPCSAGLGTGTSHPRRTHLPSLNKFFYTMYKEMQMVPPATTLMALGDPCEVSWDASSPRRCDPSSGSRSPSRHAARGRLSSDGHTDLLAAGELPSQRDLQLPVGTARSPLVLCGEESPDASLLQKSDETMIKTRAAAGGTGDRESRTARPRGTHKSQLLRNALLHLHRPTRGGPSPPLVLHPFSFPHSKHSFTRLAWTLAWSTASRRFLASTAKV